MLSTPRVVAHNLMNAPELVSLLKEHPFRPLRLHMSDGRSFEIRHPEMAWVSIHTVHLGRPSAEDQRIAEQVEYLSLRHVVSVEPIDSSVSPPA
jgi:hypothetical protein